MEHRRLNVYDVRINGNPGLTLTYFATRSNMVAYTFIGEGAVRNALNNLQETTKMTLKLM